MRSAIATLLSALFIFQTAAVNAAESSLWSDRRRAIAAAKPQAPEKLSDAQGTRAPEGSRSSDGATLLASLPAITPGLNTVQSPDLPLIALPALDPSRSVPSWVQLAVTPFATIQSARLTGNADSPTVIVMQDAHLHAEAQHNIAGTIEAIATDMSKRGEKLLVAMEGAASGPVDYSAYAAGDPAIRREVANEMADRKILSGAEVAAVASAGIANGKELFSTIGVENFSMYEANVRALRETAPMRASAELAISDLRRELVDLKRKNFDAELIRFDGRKAAYEDGKLGLPSYALYLDSQVPAQSKNLRELIEAALLEATLKFPKVEAERRRLLSKLVEKMSDAEVKGLLSVSLSFRSGQVTYADYYDLIKRLAAKHDISPTAFPEMNIYIQYVLKAEGIDHRAIFAELAEEERAVQKKLASTDAQRELLSLDSDLHLLRKLADRTLIESEWHAFEGRAVEIDKLLDRVAALGGRRPESAMSMAPNWKAFGAFYTTALARNDEMTTNLSDAAQKAGAKYSLVVAGGFHTDGIAALMSKRGYNVFILSPHITALGDGPSSLDFLAESRLPLNEIFVGERLFLPTPPATALNAPVGAQAAGRRTVATLVTSLILGVITALTTLRSPANNSQPVRLVQNELVINANHGPIAPAGGMKMNFPNGDEVAVGQFVSAFAGTPFDSISQAIRAAPNMYQFWPYLADFLRAAGRSIPANKTIFSIPDQKELLRELRAMASNPDNRNDPAIRLADTLGRTNGLMGSFAESVFRELIVRLRYTRAAPAIDRFVQANQRLQLVDAVPADVSGAVTALQGQIGAAATNVTIELYSNDKTKNYSQVNEVGEGTARRFVIKVSQEFLADKIDGRIDGVVALGGFTGPQARDQARTWLLQQWAAHELAEAVLRRRSPNTGTDVDLQQRAHDLLDKNGFGATLPKDRASFQRPVAALLKDLIARNATLFLDGAASKITVPTSAPTSPATAAPVAAPVKPAAPVVQPRPAPAAQPDSGKVTVNGYDAARQRTIRSVAGAAFAMSPDGNLIVTAGGREIRFIDARSGQTISTIQKEGPEAMAFSADGKFLVVGTVLDEAFVVNLSNPAAPVVTPLTSHTDRVTAVAFSPDGTRVLTGSWDSRVIESDARTGRVIQTYSGHAGYIWAVSYSPEGRPISSSVYETRRWKTDGTSTPVRFSESARSGAGISHGMAFSADGTKLAVESGRELLIYRTSDMTLLQRFGQVAGSAVSLAFSADGRQVVGSFTDYHKNHQVQAFDIASGLEPVVTAGKVARAAVSQTISDVASGYTGTVAVNRDGTRMGVAIPKDQTVQLNSRTPGAAYMGWARGGFVIATMIALTLVFGIRLDLVSSVFSLSGLAAVAVGAVFAATMIIFEEAFHLRYREAEYEIQRAAFIDSLKSRRFLAREDQKQLVIDLWEENNAPRFEFRGLRIVNAGDSVAVLAAGQLAFLGVGTLIISAFAVLGAPTVLFALLPLLAMTFLNAEALAPVGNAEFPNGGYLRRAIPQILSRFSRVRAADVGDALSGRPAPPASAAAAVRAPRITMRQRLSGWIAATGMSRTVLAIITVMVVGMSGGFIIGVATIGAGAGVVGMLVTGVPVAMVGMVVADRQDNAVATEDEATTVVDATPAAPAARPAPRAKKSPPIERPGPIVLPGGRGTVSRLMGRAYALIVLNRNIVRGGGAQKNITVKGVRETIAFYLGLAAYRAESASYYKQADSALKIADGVSADAKNIVVPLMREVIGIAPANNVTTIDDLFDRFQSDARYRNVTPEFRGQLVAAFLLKNRNRVDAANPLSGDSFQKATTSQRGDAVGVERNRVIAQIARATFDLSIDVEKPEARPGEAPAKPVRVTKPHSIAEIAAASRAMISFRRMLKKDGEIYLLLKARVTAMATETGTGDQSEKYVDQVGEDIYDLLNAGVPRGTAGGGLIGFDLNLGQLLDILDQYANRVALLTGQPERRQEFLGRLLSASRLLDAASNSTSQNIWQWAATNIQGREQLTLMMDAVQVFERAGAAREDTIEVAQRRDAERQAEISAALVATEDAAEPEIAAPSPSVPGAPLTVEEVVRRASREPVRFNNSFFSISPLVRSLIPFMISRSPGRAREDLAVMIARLEQLEILIVNGDVLSATREDAVRLAGAAGRLRAFYRGSADVTPEAVRTALDESGVLGDSLARSVLIQMVDLFRSAAQTVEVAFDESLPIAAFYNNRIARVVADAILNRPGRDAKGNAGLLADALYALRNANPGNPIYERLNAFLTTLNTMGALPGRATVDALSHVLNPILSISNDIAEEVLAFAGLTPDRTSDAAEKVDQELRGLLPFFELGATTVEIQLMKGEERTNEHPVGFVQRFEGVSGTHVVIRISQATLNRIRGTVNGTNVTITGTLAEAHQTRLATLGVRLTDKEASDLALRIFLLHELGEEVLGVRDQDLENLGLADRERLAALDATQGVLPENAFVSPDGIVGALGKADQTPRAIGQVKNSDQPGVPSRAADRRSRELAAILGLSRALPILRTLFANQQVLNYSLGLADGQEIIFNGDGTLNRQNLNVLEQSPTAVDRLSAMDAERAAGRTFTAQTAEQTDQRFQLGNPGTMVVYDQTGGFKDLADRFFSFKESRPTDGSRQVIGVPQTAEELTISVDAYVKMLQAKRAQPDGASLQADLDKALALQQAIAASLAGDAASRIGVVTLSAEDQALITQNATSGAWDVSAVVPIFQARAKAQFNVTVQRLVFFSDWRQLISAQLDIAVTTAMNLNTFISLEGRVQAANLVAIQA